MSDGDEIEIEALTVRELTRWAVENGLHLRKRALLIGSEMIGELPEDERPVDQLRSDLVELAAWDKQGPDDVPKSDGYVAAWRTNAAALILRPPPADMILTSEMPPEVPSDSIPSKPRDEASDSLPASPQRPASQHVPHDSPEISLPPDYKPLLALIIGAALIGLVAWAMVRGQAPDADPPDAPVARTEEAPEDDEARALRARFRRGARLSGVVAAGIDLEGADLRGIDLEGAVLNGANLEGVDLAGAKLHGADLSGATLTRANLRGADLRGAILSGAMLDDADLRDARLTGATIDKVDLTAADVRGTDLRGINLSAVILADVVCGPKTRFPEPLDGGSAFACEGGRITQTRPAAGRIDRGRRRGDRRATTRRRRPERHEPAQPIVRPPPVEVLISIKVEKAHRLAKLTICPTLVSHPKVARLCDDPIEIAGKTLPFRASRSFMVDPDQAEDDALSIYVGLNPAVVRPLMAGSRIVEKTPHSKTLRLGRCPQCLDDLRRTVVLTDREKTYFVSVEFFAYKRRK